MFRHLIFTACLICCLASAMGCGKSAPAANVPDAVRQHAQRAATAQEMLYQSAPGGEARFASSLEELLALDATLTDDPQITFRFDAVNEGYRLTVQRGDETSPLVCTPADGCVAEKK